MRPLLAALALIALTTAPSAAAQERVIVAFGDSLTAGLGVPAEQSYPSRLAERLTAEGYAYRVANAGVSGDTTAGGLRRVDWALRLKPEIVILELGANDALRGQDLAAVRANVDQLVARFQAAGARVLVAGMRLPPNYGPRYGGEFQRIFEEVARRRGAALMPFFLEGVAGVPRLNQPDGIHPTAEGYAVVVDRLWPHLRPLLGPKTGRS
jgi:acyl-CoA thioesterase I